MFKRLRKSMEKTIVKQAIFAKLNRPLIYHMYMYIIKICVYFMSQLHFFSSITLQIERQLCACICKKINLIKS